MSPRLSTLVTVARRFTRAVRVDADLTDPKALDGYVCSQSAIEALLLMGRHHDATGHGAFTWTGPYGSGKSSLAVALAAVTTGSKAARERLLADVAADDRRELLAHLRPDERPWRVIAVVGQRAGPEQAMAEAIAEAVKAEPALQRRPREAVAKWAARVAEAPGHTGLLLLVDEMGKFLEHAARADGDVHVFQDLAETAARAKGRLMVVGILHQAFDEYAHRLAREARDEWMKIQGRYLDIPINLAAEEQLDLISRAIETTDAKAERRSRASVEVAAMVGNPQIGDVAALEARLDACWPLHPIVAALLGPISRRRFGQNQRSLFGFLNSVEPFGFKNFLEETLASDRALFPVGRLWDYLRANLEPAILASPDGHRWATALEAIRRAESREASADHLELLKTIALVDLFRDRSGLQATPELLKTAVPTLGAKAAQTILDDLVEWSVVVFRKHSGSYAVYAGSDFDIDVAVDRIREAGVQVDFRQLAHQAGLQPVLAKRHYETTGALRWFEVELCALSALEDRVRGYRPAPGAAGLFLLAVSTEAATPAEAKAVLKRALAATPEQQLIVPGWTSDSVMIREMAFDLAALEQVRRRSPELEGDPVARREVDARIAKLRIDLEARLANAIYDVKWSAPKAIEATSGAWRSGPAGLNTLASALADWRYPAAPHLPNELLNRSRPSANASAAVRALLRAMVERGGQERLGLDGFPPEAGLYVSLLESTGLHRYDEALEIWRFVEPDPGAAHNLRPLWDKTDALLRASPNGMTLAEIFEVWRAPPFGVRAGLCTLLGTAYLLTRSATSALYLEGVFRPALESFLVDRLVQDPSCVGVRLVDLSDGDIAFVTALSERLSTPDHPVAASTFEVARFIIRDVRELPNWTLRTARLSAETIAFRDRARTADDPNQFLTVEVPAAFGWNDRAFPGPGLARQVLHAMDELRAAYGAMLGELRAMMLRELRAKDDERGLAALRRRAEAVKGVGGNYRLDSLATHLLGFDGEVEVIEKIASLAAHRPPHLWVDRDMDAATVELAALAQQFLKTELFQRLKGRDGGRLAMAFYISDPSYPQPSTQEVEVSAEERAAADRLAVQIQTLLVTQAAPMNVALAALAKIGLTLDQPSRDDRELEAHNG